MSSTLAVCDAYPPLHRCCSRCLLQWFDGTPFE
jgi:hypothetical protein